jgi:hypothetical protein
LWSPDSSGTGDFFENTDRTLEVVIKKLKIWVSTLCRCQDSPTDTIQHAADRQRLPNQHLFLRASMGVPAILLGSGHPGASLELTDPTIGLWGSLSGNR